MPCANSMIAWSFCPSITRMASSAQTLVLQPLCMLTLLSFTHSQALCDQLYVFGITREGQREVVQAALAKMGAAEAEEAAAKEKQKKEAEEALKVCWNRLACTPFVHGHGHGHAPAPAASHARSISSPPHALPHNFLHSSLARSPPSTTQTIAKRDHERKVAAMREWNDEELRMLDKAVAKFPQVRMGLHGLACMILQALHGCLCAAAVGSIVDYCLSPTSTPLDPHPACRARPSAGSR